MTGREPNPTFNPARPPIPAADQPQGIDHGRHLRPGLKDRWTVTGNSPRQLLNCATRSTTVSRSGGDTGIFLCLDGAAAHFQARGQRRDQAAGDPDDRRQDNQGGNDDALRPARTGIAIGFSGSRLHGHAERDRGADGRRSVPVKRRGRRAARGDRIQVGPGAMRQYRAVDRRGSSSTSSCSPRGLRRQLTQVVVAAAARLWCSATAAGFLLLRLCARGRESWPSTNWTCTSRSHRDQDDRHDQRAGCADPGRGCAPGAAQGLLDVIRDLLALLAGEGRRQHREHDREGRPLRNQRQERRRSPGSNRGPSRLLAERRRVAERQPRRVRRIPGLCAAQRPATQPGRGPRHCGRTSTC